MPLLVKLDHRNAGAVQLRAQGTRAEKAVHRNVVPAAAQGQGKVDGQAFQAAHFESLD